MSETEWTMKLRAGDYRYPVKITKVGDRLELVFPYNAKLLEEVKAMEGRRYHGYDEENPRKIWSIKDSERNRFQLAYLSGANPYEMYDGPLVEFTPSRSCLRSHQIEMTRHILTRRQCIVACEMGTGKTLSMIEAMEASGVLDWLWFGPKSALYSVMLEFKKWKSKITPKFYTYDMLKKLVANWPSGKPAPQGIVNDESSRLKNPTSQRSQTAKYLADMCRKEWGKEAWVVEMSGSPAPKDPGDWWHQCEVAKPGYIREGNLKSFKERLSIIEQRESITGGVYPHLVTWRDDENKCDICGKLKDDPEAEHDLAEGGHSFKESKNEVAALYRRMKGLVLVKFKKDCLDLPEKQYREIQLAPSDETLRAATLIQAKSPSVIKCLTLMRELSDGFQYREKVVGKEQCYLCHGTKISLEWQDRDEPDRPLNERSIEDGYLWIFDDEGEWLKTDRKLNLVQVERACPFCSGTGVVDKVERTSLEVPTPKEDALTELLDEYSDVGRVVIFGGFTGSIDRITKICRKLQWETIRADGRGWHGSIDGNPTELLERFQSDRSIERLAFIGQPGAAGMGLNLTASPVAIYWSNDFNAESRIQSEDRIHRLGMDDNRGATIVDLLHLPADALVLNNLKRKRRLQNMSLGQMQKEIQAIRFDDIRTF